MAYSPFLAPVLSPDVLGSVSMEPWSLERLRALGRLEPHHRVLDLECGDLQGMLPTVEYLEAGCYVGIDSRWADVEAARGRCASAGLGSKVPLLGGLELLDALEPRSFDVVLTRSHLNHLDPVGAERLVERVAEALTVGGVWLGVGTRDAPEEVPAGWEGEGHALGRLGLLLSRYGLGFRIPTPEQFWGKLLLFEARRNEADFQTLSVEALRRLVTFDTSPGGGAHRACVEALLELLAQADFEVEVVTAAGSAPLLVARRAATGGAGGCAVLYNHYDVDAPEGWGDADPWTLREQEGRLVGLGVGDNKGALAARLIALAGRRPAPALTWLIQGEEESGSPLLTRWLAEHGASLEGTTWVDENGWRDPDGTQRVLAARRGAEGGWASLGEDEGQRLLDALAPGGGRRRYEPRVLNKVFAGSRCAFQDAVPEDARYIAIGTNDAKTRIHEAQESIPAIGMVRHVLQFQALMKLIADGGMA